MPWLLAAALLHSAIVVEKREALKSWTICWRSCLWFSLIGTFIVRSGSSPRSTVSPTIPNAGSLSSPSLRFSSAPR
nr:hypothetical protein [Paracoccus tegillarcae]